MGNSLMWTSGLQVVDQWPAWAFEPGKRLPEEGVGSRKGMHRERGGRKLRTHPPLIAAIQISTVARLHSVLSRPCRGQREEKRNGVIARVTALTAATRMAIIHSLRDPPEYRRRTRNDSVTKAMSIVEDLLLPCIRSCPTVRPRWRDRPAAPNRSRRSKSMHVCSDSSYPPAATSTSRRTKREPEKM